MAIPFTNPWSDTIPPDSQFANLLGGDIRQLRLDLSDRMGVLFSDWETNQTGLTLLNTAGGNTPGLSVNYPGSAYIGSTTPGNFSYNYGDNFLSVISVAASVGAINLYAPILVPLTTGNIITSVSFFYDQIATLTATFSLCYTKPASTGNAVTVVATGASSGIHNGGVQTANIFSSSFTMPGGHFYLKVAIPSFGTAGTLFTIYGSGFTYTRPNVQYAL